MNRGILSEEERLKNYNGEHLCSLGLQTQNYESYLHSNFMRMYQ
jgi:hypothetical protein